MKTGNLCYRQTLIILERLALVKFDSVILHNSECDPSDCQWDPEGNTAKGQSNHGGHVQQPGCLNHQRQKQEAPVVLLQSHEDRLNLGETPKNKNQAGQQQKGEPKFSHGSAAVYPLRRPPMPKIRVR